MTLSESQLRELLTQYRRENWQGIQTPEWQQRIVEDNLSGDAAGFFEIIADYCKLAAGSMVLDVGSGVGSFVIACRQRGVFAFGIEPDRIGKGSHLSAIKIAAKRVESSTFAIGFGEHLPFRDSVFDLVTLNQVLEHVRDQEAVLHECLRVVKDGGVVYLACPNYLRFWEPHYKVLWLPLMPKPLGRLYLRLRGRNPVLLDQLNYTTHHKVRSLLKTLLPECLPTDLHRKRIVNKCVGEGEFASPQGKLFKLITQLLGVGQLALRAGLWLYRLRDAGIEYVLQKRKESSRYTPAQR